MWRSVMQLLSAQHNTELTTSARYNTKLTIRRHSLRFYGHATQSHDKCNSVSIGAQHKLTIKCNSVSPFQQTPAILARNIQLTIRRNSVSTDAAQHKLTTNCHSTSVYIRHPLFQCATYNSRSNATPFLYIDRSQTPAISTRNIQLTIKCNSPFSTDTRYFRLLTDVPRERPTPELQRCYGLTVSRAV
jgi:hypothetical protein